MYLYDVCAKKAIADLVSRHPNLDPRAAEFLNGSFLAYLRNCNVYRVDLGVGSTTKLQGSVQLVSWADAPESLKHAVANGETIMALSSEECKRYARAHAIRQVSRYVRHGNGKNYPSIQGHSMQVIAESYKQAKRWITIKRRDREASRRMVRFHVDVENGVEMFLLLGTAALGLVGSALRNCVKNAYEGNGRSTFSTTASRIYVAFRDMKTQKWTSLGDVYTPLNWSVEKAQLTGLKLQQICHEWLENNAVYEVPADRALWERLLDGEFTDTLHRHWHQFHSHAAERRARMSAILHKPIFGYETGLTRDITFGWDNSIGGFRTGRGLVWFSLEAGLSPTYQRYHMGLRTYERDSEAIETRTVASPASSAFSRTRNQLALRGEQQRHASSVRRVPGMLRGLVQRLE